MYLTGQDAFQEVLLILEECWNNSPELQNVPIYQASGLARRAISVYQTYIEMMNDDIKAAFQVRNIIPYQAACCAVCLDAQMTWS